MNHPSVRDHDERHRAVRTTSVRSLTVVVIAAALGVGCSQADQPSL